VAMILYPLHQDVQNRQELIKKLQFLAF